jgi:HEAT repeat protein
VSIDYRPLIIWSVFTAVPIAAIPEALAARQIPVDSAALFDRNAAVREEAVRALGARGEPALPDLLRALFDQDRRVRRAAIEALTDVGGERALDVLAAAVHDTDARLRENVVYAAGRIGSPGAETIVEMLSADPSDAVREAARVLLSEFRTRRARQLSQGEGIAVP